MPFEIPWDEATPPGNAPANTAATELRNLEKAVSERMVALGVTNWDTATDTDIAFAFIKLLRIAATKIVGGSTSLALRNNADSADNVLVEDDGDVTVRKDLAVLGKFANAIFTGDVTIESGETFLIQSETWLSAAQGWIERHNKTNISGATEINWTNSNNQAATLTADVSFTFTNPKPGAWYTLELRQGGAGGFVVTAWPGTVVWPAGTAPVLTTTAGRTDLISFYWNGTAYIGVVIAQDFNV